MKPLTPRVQSLREQLSDPGPQESPTAAADDLSACHSEEPFHEAWLAGEGLDPRLQLARAQAAELAAVRPFIRPGELILGDSSLRSVVSSRPRRVDLNRALLERLRVERPDAAPALAEIEAYWSRWLEEHVSPVLCHASLAYERVLGIGLDGLRGHVREWAARHAEDRPDTGPWYEALLIVLDGISAFIAAHGEVAEAAAKEEASAERREELASIAASCRHLAHGAPRTFLEAAQFWYFLFWICGHDSPGPIDRALYPALRRDLDSGTLSLEAAQEIVDCLWLKLAGKAALGATIGGRLPDGSDATNELSYLCLSAIRRLRLIQPRTALRWHRDIDREFFAQACDVLAEGASYPALVNDEAIIPAMIERGFTPEHAREYTFVGCGQTYPHGRGHGNYEDVLINAAKPLELALNGGLDPCTGSQAGPPSGAVESLASFDDLLAAYHEQLRALITSQVEALNACRRRGIGHCWDFLRSLFTHSCIERGLDWHEGGADYSEGMVDMIGLTTVADSLVAIRRAVFEERKLTLPELVEVLRSDWADAEHLRQYCLHLPKFGNMDAEADDLAAAEVAYANDTIKTHRTVFGGPWGMDIVGWSGAVLYGEQTGATPDGRRAGQPLADCAGPAQGRNTHGPTATLNSVLRLPHAHAHGPLALSLRFPPATVRTPEQRAKLRALIESYFERGGQQLQISIAGTEEMRAAQQTPELYGSLIVRVGGFSAYFTRLDRRFQDDMIARAELALAQ